MSNRLHSNDLTKAAPADWTDLHYAVWNHNYDQVRSLVRTGNINSLDSSGWSPLHLACTSEDALLFDIHQINARGLSRFGNDKRYNRYAWGRTRKHSVNFDNTERTQSMGILEILLQNGAYPNATASNFCTPLHCAANSGWSSHATALIKAGANVYTGPQCSPLCWAKDGSGSDHPIARLLRDELGPEGMRRIEEDHQRDAADRQVGISPRVQHTPAAQLRLPINSARPTMRGPGNGDGRSGFIRLDAGSHETPMIPVFRHQNEGPPAFRAVNSDGLCPTCANMTLDDLVKTPGYVHFSSLELVRTSATSCSFCKIIYSLLGKGRKTEKGDVTQVIVQAIADDLKRYQPGQILRMLELKISAACFCGESYGIASSSLDFENCQGKCKPLATTRVGIFTLADVTDYPHKVLTGNKLDSDPLSEHSLSIARNWLHECGMKHPDCAFARSSSSRDESPMPNRVIDVSNFEDGGMIKLCLTGGLSGQFVALSHRWVSGPMPDWVTTEKTVEQRMTGFPLQELPTSIVDAVKVTQKLGLKYLWVDSCCIIQDSARDWEIESSRMVEIYAGAYITIFADCARDDDEGFIRARQSYGPAPTLLKIQSGILPPLPVYVRYADASIRQYNQPSEGRLFQSDVMESCLGDRAWILQERVMSRRILHFGKDQLFWECRTTSLAEDGHLFQQEHWRKWLIEIQEVILETPLTDVELSLRWSRLVEEYTARKLTMGKDKLTALAGIASIFAARTQDWYYAGLWKSSFHLNLHWHTRAKDPDDLPARPPDYRAPSWSWASIDSAVYMRGDRKPEDFDRTPAFDIIDAHVETTGADSFGQVRSCSVVLSALLKPAISIGPYKEQIGDTDKGYNPVYNSEMAPVATMRHDALDDVHTEHITCLKLYDNDPLHMEHFLVIVPVASGDGRRIFRRIGFGDTLLWGRSQYEKGSLFEGCEKEIITLI